MLEHGNINLVVVYIVLVDNIYENSNYELKYDNGNYDNVDTNLFNRYPKDSRGHRNDAVKKSNHPSHPSRGRFTKDGKVFFMSDKGMNNPNLTLFGLADGNDPQATIVYKGGIVLPEVTVTRTNDNYIDNLYDTIKIYFSNNRNI